VRSRTARTFKVGAGDVGRRLTCSATGRSGALRTTATLRITVPARCVVPGVRGLTLGAARTKLGNAGCRTRTSMVTSTALASGLVLGTSPARGARRPNGSRITIRVRR
jgi:beta-lactam-binding protein with PASTA domain